MTPHFPAIYLTREEVRELADHVAAAPKLDRVRLARLVGGSLVTVGPDGRLLLVLPLAGAAA